MGLFSSIFGSKSKTENKFDVPDSLQATLDSAQYAGQNAYGQGFQAFGSDRFTDFNADQLAAFDLARDFGQPSDSLAYQLEQQGLNRFLGAPTLEELQPFMDPYLEGVLDRTKARNADLYDTELSNLQNSGTYGDAWGGSRMAVAERELGESFLNTQADLEYQGLSDAFNQGIDRFYQTGQAGYDNSQTSQTRDLDRINALFNIGDRQYGQEQQQLDFDYQEFIRSVNEPKQDALGLAQIGQMYPTGIIDSTQTTTSTPSLFNAIAGVAGLAAGGLGLGAGGVGAGASTVGGYVAPQIASQVASSYGPTTPSFGGGWNNNAFVAPKGYKDGGLITKDKAYKNPFVSDKKYADGGGIFGSHDIIDFGLKAAEKVGDAAEYVNDNGYVGTYNNLVGNPFAEHVGLPVAKFFMGKGDAERFVYPKKKTKAEPKTSKKSPVGYEELVAAMPRKVDSGFASLTGDAPTPSVAPQTERPATFGTPQHTQPAVVQPQADPEQNWYDKWMENPLTNIGLALLAGNTVSDSAQILMNQKATKDQRAIDEQNRQQSQTMDQARLNLQREELEVNKQRYAQQSQNEQASISARLSEVKDVQKQRRLQTIATRISQLDSNIVKMMDNPMMSADNPQLRSLMQQRDRYMADFEAGLAGASPTGGSEQPIKSFTAEDF